MQLVSWKHTLAIFLVAAFFAAIPYPYMYVKMGYQAPTIPVAAYTGEGGEYYFMRMEEIKDGYPLMGNPFFIEHREEISPAFFLADWFAAIPLLLGGSWMFTVIFNLFLWSFLFLLLVFLLMRILGLSSRWSIAGALLSYMEVCWLMARPVSMQVIFPFYILFLIAFVLWLKDTQHHRKQALLGFASALTAYLYTYAWQIVIVVLLLTPIHLFFAKRKNSLRAFVRVIVYFVTLSIPLILFTIRQIDQPFYLETMQRIGLIDTHLPTSASIEAGAWICALFALGIFLYKKIYPYIDANERTTVIPFFVIVGLSMTAVMFSNIITGKDLELPQHIERFVVIWFALASVYLCSRLLRGEMSRNISASTFVLGVLLIAVVSFGNIRYLINGGPGMMFSPAFNFTFYKQVQGFDVPLSWLRDNVKEQSVIWADPHGHINDYIVTQSQHYVLFKAAGVLHIVSNKELEERYLVANYFDLSEADLENDYWSYGGVGNAVHQWKTENRRVRVCKILHLDYLGHPCGELTDRVSWKGKSYFTELYQEYLDMVKPNIEDELKKYHVSYAIRDNETDTPVFKPGTLAGAREIYTDGRFTIYKFEY